MMKRAKIIHSSNIALRALKIAQEEIGIKDDGNNTSRSIQKYLRAVGVPPGFNWDVAFVSWCLQQAAPNNQLPLTTSPGHLLYEVRKKGEEILTEAYQTTRKPFQFINAEKTTITATMLREGDIFIIGNGESQRAGFIEKLSAEKSFKTIEGNALKPNCNKTFVLSRFRKIDGIRAVIRIL